MDGCRHVGHVQRCVAGKTGEAPVGIHIAFCGRGTRRAFGETNRFSAHVRWSANVGNRQGRYCCKMNLENADVLVSVAGAAG